jgi:hypothetical protein
MLHGSEADLREFNDPIAIPIYGRGRAHFGLVGGGINPQMVEETGQFLCGACSCQVKDENPGVDIVMAVDWAHQVHGTAMPPIVLPELTGIGGLDVATQLAATGSPADEANQSQHSPPPQSTAAAARSVETEPLQPSTQPTATEALAPITTPTAAPSSGPAARTPQRVATDDFQRWLLLGVAGGLVVAVAVLSLATFWLRRTV